jgi:hypothetical protein
MKLMMSIIASLGEERNYPQMAQMGADENQK